MNSEPIKILLADGSDRQVLPLSKAYKELGCHVTTLNGSRLDNGYSSRYPDEKLLEPEIVDNKKRHWEIIKSLLMTGKYDVAISTSDETAEGLSLMKEELQGKANLAVVSPSLFYKAYDKRETMAICHDNGIPCIETYFGIKSIDDIESRSWIYPLVVKPRMSYGAIGFHKVENEAEFRQLLNIIQNEIDDYVFQEFIPQTDIQYECAMFLDDNNEVKTSCVFSKTRWYPVKGGSSTCNVTVDRPDIVDTCTKLLQVIHWRGPADIDLIQDPRDGVAKVMEINPRVSGSVKILFEAGVNIAEQIMQLALGRNVTDYRSYKMDVRMRCFHTDLLWFLESSNRFRAQPSWFSWRNTYDQIFSLSDPFPFFAFSIQALKKYRKEKRKRKSLVDGRI